MRSYPLAQYQELWRLYMLTPELLQAWDVISKAIRRMGDAFAAMFRSADWQKVVEALSATEKIQTCYECGAPADNLLGDVHDAVNSKGYIEPAIVGVRPLCDACFHEWRPREQDMRSAQ